MELENFKEKSDHDKALKEACDRLWEDHIRPSLIFGRKLQLCRPCQAFHSQGDPESDHPKDQVVLVLKHFAEQGVTSSAKLFEFFKASPLLSSHLDKRPDILPSFSAKHLQLPAWPGRASTAGPEEAHWLKERVLEVERELADLTAKVADLEDQKLHLEAENDELMTELLRQQVAFSQEKKAIARLAHSLHAICHQDGTRIAA
jgi:hypothetical protein